jgi:hypothetical protein
MTSIGIREISLAEADEVSAGSLLEAAAAGLAGVTAATRVAALAGAASGGTGAALVLLGGFAGGVALYYLTD